MRSMVGRRVIGTMCQGMDTVGTASMGRKSIHLILDQGMRNRRGIVQVDMKEDMVDIKGGKVPVMEVVMRVEGLVMVEGYMEDQDLAYKSMVEEDMVEEDMV